MRLEKQLVIFRLDDMEFGFPVEVVQEIVRPGTLVRVPLTPPYLLGLTNLRGNILPVVDTRLRLGLVQKENDDHTRLLVLNLPYGRVCFLVDEVREVRSYRDEELEPPPEGAEQYEHFVEKVVKFDGGERVVFLLEAERLAGARISEGMAEAARASFSTSGYEGERTESRRREIRVLSFRLGSEEYAFPIKVVREIIRFRTLKPLPEASEYVRGLLTLRQSVLPVFDLRALLELEPIEIEVSRLVSHLRRVFEHRMSQGEIGERGVKDIVRAWIEERLERSRNEAEYTLLKQLANFYEAFCQSEDPEVRESLAEEILGVFDQLEKELHRSLLEEQRILILEHKGRVFGLLVDRVEEVCGLSEDDLDPSQENDDLRGIARLSPERIIFVLDEKKVLPQEDLEEFSTQGGEEMSAKEMDHHEELQLVTFYLGNEEYGIPITTIQEINRLGKITRVPRTPEFVEGVTNLRGEVIPVIDLRKRFGIEAGKRDDRTRLVIIQLNGKKTGLIVDRVNEVARLSAGQIEPPPPMLETEVDLSFISSIAKLNGDRMILVLDVDRIFSPQEKEALGAMMGEETSEEVDQEELLALQIAE